MKTTKALWIVLFLAFLGCDDAPTIRQERFKSELFTQDSTGVMGAASASGTIVKHYRPYYAGTPYFNCDQFIIENSTRVAAPDPFVLDRLKALDPTFPCDAYKSATDAYTLKDDGTQHEEEAELQALCAQLGLNLEDCFLHWQDETVIDWDYTGQNPDLITYPAGSRIVKYRGAHQSGNRTRIATHFGASRAALTQAMVNRATKLTAAGNGWDGVIQDNCGKAFYSYGVRVVSGGHVLEAGGLPIAASPQSAFVQWYWPLQRQYLVETRAALNAAGKKSAINVANAWSDDYFTYGCADYVYMEFVGQMTRDGSLFSIASHKQHHELANSTGIYLCMGPPVGYGGVPAETDQEIIYGALCQSLLVDQGFSMTHNQDLTWPYRADWPQRIDSPAETIVEATSGPRLGTVASNAEIFMEGTSPGGNHFTVWIRYHSRGAVLGRMLEPYNGLTTDVVSFPRPAQMRLVNPDASITTPPFIEIKNGGGAILVF